MNQVSDLNLAIAVHKAGGFPSISGYCYKNANQLINALEDFVKITGSSNLILAIDEHWLLNPNIISTIKRLNISHLFKYFNENPKFPLETKLAWREPIDKLLEKLDSQLIGILPNFNDIQDLDKIYFLKGNDGAGRPGAATTKELFDYHIQQTPNAKLVPMGGVGTASQVKYYIDNGAIAVSVGTLLAASKESCLTEAVKQAMVAASNSNLSILDTNLKQQGLVFKEFSGYDTANHTNSLKLGINSNADAGHIFAGHGINFINTIDDVASIILKLADKI